MVKELSDHVVIATTVMYNESSKSDMVRADLALNLVSYADTLGYTVLALDGGIPKTLETELIRNKAKVIKQQSKGMGAGRREIINHAYNLGKPIIVWTEPEKDELISELQYSVSLIADNEADIVIPSRKSLDSYPLFQRHTEKAANIFWEKMTGYKLDITFGPRVWHRDLTHYFLDYDGKYGDKYDSINIPIIKAIEDNKKVIGVPVEFRFPERQKQIEENDISFYTKRIGQFNNHVSYLRQYYKI